MTVPSTALPSSREVAIAMCSEDDSALNKIHAEFRAVQEATASSVASSVSWMETLTEALVQNAISGMRGGGLLPERVGPGEVARVLCPGIVPSGALDDAAVESNLILTIRLLARTKGAGETATQTIIPLARVCSEPLSSRPLELSSRVKRLLPPVHRRDLAGAISALQIGVYMQDTDIIETLMKTVHGSVRLTERDLAVAHFCVLKFATTKSREILNTLRGLCSVEVDRTGEFIAEFLIALDLTHSLAVTKLLSMLDEEVVNLKGRAPMLEYADYLPAGASVAHLLLVCFDRGIGGVCEVLPHVMARWQAQLALQQLDLGPVDVQCLDLVGTAPLLRCLQPLRLTVGVGEGTSCLVDEMMKYGARRSFAIMAMYRHLGRRVRAQPRAGCRCKVCTRWLALPLDIEPLIWANLARIAQGDDDEVNRAEWIKYDRSQQLNELLVYRDEGVDDDQTVLMKMEMLIDEGADPNIPLEGRWASVESLFPIHSCTSPAQVGLLHRKGADMNALCQGQTAADIALIRGDQETCRCLLLLGTSLTSKGIRRLLSLPRERALATYPSGRLLSTGWARKVEVLSQRAHAAETALYKLGGLFANLDNRRDVETRELDSNIQRLENVVEVKREQLSVLERDVDEENNAARQGRALARCRRKLACKCGAKVRYATVDCGHGLCEDCRCKAGARCPDCGQAIPKGFVQLRFLCTNTYSQFVELRGIARYRIV